VNFWKDCQAFTVSTMGAEAADNFHTFDANCRQQASLIRQHGDQQPSEAPKIDHE
jgi:hypothetical protein